MCCWAYVSLTAGKSANGLITNHNISSKSGVGITVRWISDSDYRVCCNTGNKINRSFNLYYGTTNIKDSWHHLALTYSREKQLLKLWVDSICEYTLENYDNYSLEEYFSIFDWELSTERENYKPQCKLNDVRVYNHCLSSYEIKEISKGLVLHYPLNLKIFPENLIFYDYLESTGTLYIDTEYIPNLDTSLYTHIYIKDANGHLDFFGASNSANSGEYVYGFYDGGSKVYDNYNNDVEFKSEHISGDITISKIKNITLTIGDYNYTATYNAKTFSSETTLYIFARNYNNTGFRPSRIKMYYCKIYDGDTLVKYMLPCTYQGEPGMWDLVENKFYGNSGTGAFIVGNEPWKHYVLDGLIFMLDIDNLTDKSTWKDLTGNYGEFSFDESKGIIAHDNYVEFLGINGGYIDTGTQFGQLSDMTIEICYKVNTIANLASVFSAVEGGNTGFLMWTNGENHFLVGKPSGSYYNEPYILNLAGDFSTLSGSINTTTGKIIVCGNKDILGIVNNYTGARYNTYTFQIGTDAGSIVGFDGRIYSIRVYNRGLSTEEMKRNETLDILRFSNL